MVESSVPLTPIEAEARQLGLRYDSFTRTTVPVTNEIIYSLIIKPTEPDLPFPIPSLLFEFTLPSTYPMESPSAIKVHSTSLPNVISNMFSTHLLDHVRNTWSTLSSTSINSPPTLLPIRTVCKWIESVGTGIILRKIIQEQSSSSGVVPVPTVTSSTTESTVNVNHLTHIDKEENSGTIDTRTTVSPSLVTLAAVGTTEKITKSSSNSSITAVPSTVATLLSDSTEEIFRTQDKWTLVDQQAYEYALYEYVIEKHRSLTQPETWILISKKIHEIIEEDSILVTYNNNNNHPVNTKSLAIITPETCLARYLVLRKLCSNWLNICVPSSLLNNKDILKTQEKLATTTGSGLGSSSGSNSGNKTVSTISNTVSSSSNNKKITKGKGTVSSTTTIGSIGPSTVASSSSKRYADQKISLNDLDNDDIIDPLPLTTAPPVRLPSKQSTGVSSKAISSSQRTESVSTGTSSQKTKPLPMTTTSTTAPVPVVVNEPEIDMFGRVIYHGNEDNENVSEEDDDNDEYDSDDEDYTDNEEDASTEDNDNDDEKGNENDDDDDDEEEDDPILPLQNIHLVTPHRGTQLLLDRLSIFGIGTLAASSITVLTQCDRCSTVMSASITGAILPPTSLTHKNTSSSASNLASNTGTNSSSSSSNAPTEPFGLGVWKSWCPKCSLLLSLAYRPMLVHDGNPSLGYIDCTNCSIVSLLYAYMILSCLECNTFVEHNPPRITPPMVYETTCRTCYSRLRLDTHGFTAQIATKDNDQSGLNKSKQKAIAASISLSQRKRSQRFTAGHPLPQEGTCVHYKKSYRWLRFPCCNLAFPCDKCHDNNSDHPHEWATRMICGHCAREQPFVLHGACVSCGESMTKTIRNTSFWEGGEGERNKIHMNRKDPRKYKDSKNKTHSRKALRVGPKPWRKRQNKSSTSTTTAKPPNDGE